MPRITPIVKNLIIINVLFFLFSSIAGSSPGLMKSINDLLPVYHPSSSMFRPWQIITHMFMHVDFRHILFNMFGLFFLGATLERFWGPKRFVIYYVIAGLGGLLLQTGVNAYMYYEAFGTAFPIASELPVNVARTVTYSNMRGASGAVFGLLLAFGYLFPNTPLYLFFIPIPIKAKYFVIGYGLIELFSGVSGFMGPGGGMVAHFAHIGGMLFGFILLLYWQKKKDKFY